MMSNAGFRVSHVGRYSIALLLALLVNPLFASANPAAFDEGIAAFEKADYTAALQHFHQAEAAGMDSSALHFNLGVCYFKLQQYSQAEAQFVLTATDQRMAQLAHYNLGLTALRQANHSHAETWFRLAAASKQDAKLTKLAEHRLAMLGSSDLAQPRIFAGGTVAYGYDDNVTLLATESPSHQSDNYLEALLYANLPLTNHLRLNGSVYLQDYRRVNTADFSQYNLDVGYEINWHDWRLLPEAGLDKSNLGGKAYLAAMNLTLSARHHLTENRNVLLRLRYSDITADNTLYNYLDGSRLQWRVEYRQPTQLGKLRIRYELETNQRKNSSTTNYSPTRHDIRLRLDQVADENWQFREELQYRQSRYGDIAGVTRKDDRKVMMLQTSRKFTKAIAVGLKYTRSDNNSSVSLDSYRRNDYQVFMDITF